MMRTHKCGELRIGDVDKAVTLCGWVATRREHGEHLAFIDVRDATGLIQCVIDGSVDLHSEDVVRINGIVRRRPEGTVNANLETGEVEIGNCEVEVLSTSEPVPFPVTDRIDADENLRLQHRYVDLRRPRMQKNLRLRAKINAALRQSMAAQDFVEVETPMLIASTPEGARDFVVPSRLRPGSFYALPQSPQLFKQLLMVGGLDRYFQIARCLRDEDLRADRQFEFMQYDAEASFVDQQDVLEFVTHSVMAAVKAATGEVPAEFGRITWQEAMDRYGSDKPDIRFGMELVDLTHNFSATEFKAFQAESIKGIRVQGAADYSRSRLDALVDMAKQFGAKGLVWAKVGEANAIDSPVTKFLSTQEQSGIVLSLQAEAGDLLLLIADDRATVNRVLGLMRLELGKPPVTEGGLQFLWVVDFPLFEGLSAEGRPIPAHHPFTAPHPDDIHMLDTDPLAVRSQAYDLVLNGWELGSGSIRIHQADTQQRVFDILGITPEQAQTRFGFLLEAFRYGPPPHGGFAFGIDRLVALLAGEENIREVIAFPKTQSGADPLTTAPTEIDEKLLRELGIARVKTK